MSVCGNSGPDIFTRAERQKFDDIDITSADDTRLEGWNVKAFQAGLCDYSFEAWKCSAALVDIRQTPGYGKIRLSEAPCLLRNINLFDLVTGMRVPLSALWVMQGFPHPMCSDIEEHMRAFFPFNADAVLEDIPEGAGGRGQPLLRPPVQKHLLGNGMHVSQIGTWCLYWLGMPSARPLRIQLLNS